ncbi:aldo/keto reductase [Streptomyces silvisoli]|uniref:Aldo/keto reductase n=1 Tax=Streptomyces silvisoli TaxID=3034235 RepID=A0ABT5ZL31_9ACTN|nr:aldo/keto reductase [Streptomyces silvisoli]MDF3290290.1 aldo/keto reductase [Streptomyces silvisoli]
MDYTNLGRSGLKVSRLCLGTMNFGSRTAEQDSHAIMDHALDNGINFFDTADVYGSRSGRGGTERIIGRWFAQGGARRDRVVLATKVYGKHSDWPNDRGLSARHVIQACNASLRRLGTDWIDLYQMHHIDRSTPWEEVWQAMEVLVLQGKVRYVGSSNFAGWHLAAAQAAADRRHFFGLVSEQCVYNLATRQVELDVIPSAIAHGIGILPWSPLHGGLLSGSLRKQRDGAVGRSTTGRSTAELAKRAEEIEAYERLCSEGGYHPADIALSWLLRQPGVTAPVIGPRTVAQLDRSIGALAVRVDQHLTARLGALFPPPERGEAAPAAKAWLRQSEPNGPADTTDAASGR